MERLQVEYYKILEDLLVQEVPARADFAPYFLDIEELRGAF